MNWFTKLTLAAALATIVSPAAFAAEYTKGVVKKVDVTAKKVTIIHEELTNLDMPAMTMVFRTADDSMLEQLAEGETIEFVADRVDGKLTVVEIK